MTYTLTSQTAPTFLFDSSVSADELLNLDLRPHIPFSSNGHTIEIHPVSPTGDSNLCGN